MTFKKGHKPIRKQPPVRRQPQPRPRRLLTPEEVLEQMGAYAWDLV